MNRRRQPPLRATSRTALSSDILRVKDSEGTVMTSRQTLIRLRRFDVDEKQQKVTDIEVMIADFARVANELQQQIAIEEERAGVKDPSHFSYPTFAKAAKQRHDNLLASIAALKRKLAEATSELEEAKAELEKAEKAEERESERMRRQGDHMDFDLERDLSTY